MVGVSARTAASDRLTASARELTVERGLRGFRVEEVTAAAGVSRRTFFNHFASKEHAVLGLTRRVPQDVGEAEFLDGSGGLLDDLGGLMLRRMGAYVRSAEDFSGLLQVLDREPGLVALVTGAVRDRSEADVLLVERREGMAAGDARARLAVETARLLIQRVLARRITGTSGSSISADYALELTRLRDVVDRAPG